MEKWLANRSTPAGKGGAALYFCPPVSSNVRRTMPATARREFADMAVHAKYPHVIGRGLGGTAVLTSDEAGG